MSEWTQHRIESEYIEAKAVEGQRLDYKRADALGMSDGKKNEVVKDVSAMANASGGVIIYGVAEEKHADNQPGTPSDLDPIKDGAITAEWLSQVINGVDPPLTDVQVHPIPIADGGVVFVVAVPQGTTAHQAKDHRYWRRYIHENKSMPDDQVRDVMNRSLHARLTVTFGAEPSESDNTYWLRVTIKNWGPIAVKDWKFDFSFPDQDVLPMPWNSGKEREALHMQKLKYSHWHGHGAAGIRSIQGPELTRSFACRSTDLLFPEEEHTIEALGLLFSVTNDIWANRGSAHAPAELPWVLYADNSPPLRGHLDYQRLIHACRVGG